MATQGRGDFPFRSTWFREPRLQPRKPIVCSSDGVAAKAVWQDWFFEAAVGGDASAALTGSATTSAHGSLGLGSHEVPLVGSVTTSAAGTVTAEQAITAALTGSVSTSAPGSVEIGYQGVALTGLVSTGAAGTVSVAGAVAEAALVGSVVTMGHGTLYYTISSGPAFSKRYVAKHGMPWSRRR